MNQDYLITWSKPNFICLVLISIMRRRTFLKNSILTAGLAGFGNGLSHACRRLEGQEFSVSAITGGDKQHWFGYYDKWQISKNGRYALGGEVETFFRSPRPNDSLKIGLIDLKKGFQWKEIGSSHSWGWQQGCMLQWLPESDSEVIWNDYGNGGYVSKVYNIKTGKTRVLPKAIYTLSPNGRFALCVDFDRLQFFRPGYGYPTKNPKENWPKAPGDKGIYKMDLSTGEYEMIISYEQIAPLNREKGSVKDNFHWFNHLLINPSGTRFIFLNRSRPVGSYDEMTIYRKNHPELKNLGFSGHYVTRAITADVDGKNIYTLNDSGNFSHFIWNGDQVICAWAVPDGGKKAAFFDFYDQSKRFEQVGKGIMTHNGHNTYVPNTNYEWILNDTYPQGSERLQELYLYHIPTNRKVTLGKFYEPGEFSGEWRCDLHPRCDQQGKRVFFDSTHEGGKRQMYMIEISKVVGS